MNILNYIFTANPGHAYTYYFVFVPLAILLIAFGFQARMKYNKLKREDYAYKRLFKSMHSRSMMLGLLILFLVLIRFEQIPYFSMRIWSYAVLGLVVWLAYKYIQKFRIDYPREKQNVKFIKEKAARNSKNERKYTTAKKKNRKKSKR